MCAVEILEKTVDQTNAQILLMEDETNLAKGLQMVLQEEGYAVDVADTGMSALEKLGRHYFDLVVADLRLPDIDGMEVVRQVRQSQPDTEAIIITGYPSVASAVESAKMGVHDYIRKPFTEDEFKEAVDGALKHKREVTIEEILVETEHDRLIQKQEVVRVLDRTAADRIFWRNLMEHGSSALRNYHLSSEAKAAIASGDLNWIRTHVGELTQAQLQFIYRRLEREAW